jgi:CBS domain-containing protein
MEVQAMKVQDVMTRSVECAGPDATLQEVACRMRDLNVGTIPVTDGSGLLGIVTDRDLAIRALASGKAPDTPVRLAMTANVICCKVDDDVKDAAQLMKEHQVRRLVVTDQTRQVAGIVSLGDLAVETRNDKMVGDALERISEPVHPVV